MNELFSEQALDIIEHRYLARNDRNEIVETPEDMFKRVAKTLGENKTNELYKTMIEKKFVPAGRTLANAGGPTKLVSNCIVLGFKDSMEGIFQTLKDASQLQQQGCGLGFAWHLLRPAGSMAKTNRGISSGPVSFMRVYNQAFGVIKQQNRHGANMGVMSVDHPDILEFIHCKEKEGDFINFNISVGLTDKFMKAVFKDEQTPWMCEFPCNRESDFEGEVQVMLPRRIKRDNREVPTEIIPVKMTAKQLFDEIVSAAWSNGEPGVIFLDTINKSNPLPANGKIHTTNPCGEQGLQDGDVCNLGSLNLGVFVKNKEIDWKDLEKTTRLAVMALDNVIDQTEHSIEKVNTTMRNNRRIGLGIMGWADMLIKLDIGYNTKRALELAEEVMTFINETAHNESEKRAVKLGSFPNIKKSVFAKIPDYKKRNAAITTVAPTGTISMVFDCSSGIEPHFALAYVKTVMQGRKFYYINEDLQQALKERNLYTDELIEQISQTGSIQHLNLPEDMKTTFVCAMDINANDHIEMQAAFQKHIDNSISKTINFPNTATKKDVQSGYYLAWTLGCKGCTVYRDGSRNEQVLTIEAQTDKNCKSGVCDL